MITWNDWKALLPRPIRLVMQGSLVRNHFHLLLKTGCVPIATVMRRLLIGYAIRFNRRHGRTGRLFQNRYKSILCQEDIYAKELIRYIHWICSI